MNKKIWIIGLLAILVIIIFSTIISLTILLMYGGTESNEPTLNEYGEDYEVELGVACFVSQEFVLDKVKSPSTAEFQSCKKYEYGGVYVGYVGNQTYNTVGYVDAQNDFGAIVRIDYVTTIIDNQDGTWNLTHMNYMQK